MPNCAGLIGVNFLRVVLIISILSYLLHHDPIEKTALGSYLCNRKRNMIYIIRLSEEEYRSKKKGPVVSELFIHLFMYLWMKNVTCHISKQRRLQPSSHQLLHYPLNTNFLRCTLRGLRMEKIGYWPYIIKVHVKGMVSVSPVSCIFPYIEKC